MRQAALLVALLLVLTVPVATAGAQELDTADRQVVMELSLQGDGDARWNVTMRIPLESANETRAFERLASEFEAGSNTGFSAQPFEQAVRQVNATSDRRMQLRNVDRDAYVTNGSRTGVLTLQFTWTNFAETENGTVSIRETFAGSWFGDLGDRQTLIIRPPAGYQVDTAQPSFDLINGSLRWQGPQAFESGQPTVRFVEVTEPPGGSWAVTAFAALVALVIGAGAVYVWVNQKRRSREQPAPTEGGVEPEEESGGAAAEGEVAASATAGKGGADAVEETDGETAGGTAEEATEPELLSDEERVERLLREHGGRMKQARIVDETRWSNAKVSQLLSSMADEGRIEKLRIGRENLISLPEYGEDESEESGTK